MFQRLLNCEDTLQYFPNLKQVLCCESLNNKKMFINAGVMLDIVQQDKEKILIFSINIFVTSLHLVLKYVLGDQIKSGHRVAL